MIQNTRTMVFHSILPTRFCTLANTPMHLNTHIQFAMQQVAQGDDDHYWYMQYYMYVLTIF